MEIHSVNDGLITTVEVLTLLKERLRARKQRPQKQSKHTVPKNRDWIEKEVIKYLKSTSPKGASPEHVVSFLKALDELCDAHNLTFTLAERLQLIDVRPILPVEIYVVIDECDERLTDEHVEALLECVNTHLIAPTVTEADDGATVAETVDGGSTVTGGQEEGEEDEAPPVGAEGEEAEEEAGGDQGMMMMQVEEEFVAEASAAGGGEGEDD